MQQRSSKHRLAVLTLAGALALGAVAPVGAIPSTTAFAAAVNKPVSNVPSIGSVKIVGNSTLELKKASLVNGEDGKKVVFTITVNNRENRDIQSIYYWVKLRGADGTQYSVQMMPGDKNKNNVPANSSMDLTFYASVSEKTKLQDLIFKLIQWDFSLPAYERSLGELKVPANYSIVTPINHQRIIPITGTELATHIESSSVYQNDEYSLTSVQLSMENTGFKSARVPAYHYYIETAEGLMYPLEVSGAAELTIAPRVKNVMKLSTSVPKSVSTKGWKLVMMEIEPNLQLEMPVASYALVDPVIGNTGGGEVITSKQTIEFAGNKLNTELYKAVTNKNKQNYMLQLNMTMENVGSRAVKVPNYEAVLKTKSGLIYPLEAPLLQDLTLNPLVSKDIEFSVSIPLSVDVEDLELHLIQPAEENPQQSYTVAVYKVPESKPVEVSIGDEQSYTNEDGSYVLKLNGIQRLAWEDDDLISAELAIMNKSDVTLPVPEVQGYFLLDGRVKVNADLVKLDHGISLPAQKGAVHVAIVGKIPYFSQFEDVRLVLQEKSGDGTNKIAELKHNSSLLKVPTIAKGGTYKVSNAGRATGVTLKEMVTYEAANSHLIYVEMDVQNLESRFSKPSKLTGFFRTSEDVYFPITITDYQQRLAPRFRTTAGAWAVIPKDFDLSDMQLMIGEEVSPDSGASTDAYVQVARMVMPDERPSTVGSIEKFSMQPFEIQLSEFNARLVANDAESFEFSADYVMSKTSQSAMGQDVNRKLVVEIKDSAQRFEHKFTVGEGDLEVGQGTLRFTKKNTDLFYKMMTATDLTISVYDEWNGHKRLIGEQRFDWNTLLQF